VTISRVNKCQLPFPALVLNTITPPQPHHNRHVFTHATTDKTREERRRARRREKGGCTRYAHYIFLFISISYCFPPAPSHLPQLCHAQSPNTKNAPFMARFSISAAILRVWWVSCPAPIAANPLTCLTCPLPPAKHKEHAAWGVFSVFGTHRT